MNYKSEADFGHALDKVLMKYGYFIRNMQVGATHTGCPDRYLCRGINKGWLELKNQNQSIFDAKIKIDYRPGQQGWLVSHASHGGLSLVGVALRDGHLFYAQKELLPDEVYSIRQFPELRIVDLHAEIISDWLTSLA